MSTIADELKQATRAASRPSPTARTRVGATTIDGATITSAPLVIPRASTPQHSKEIGLVVQAILFCAACLSLVAVTQQVRAGAQTSGTGVSDPPPAVFVNAD